MTAVIRHRFRSAKPNGADLTKVSANPWNDDHEIIGSLTASPYFGVGIDGALGFDGTATVLGISPVTVGSNRVYTLTRDVYATTIVVGSGVKIFAANWRVFASVSITGAGSALSFIHNDGNSAPTSVAGGSIIPGGPTPSGFFHATLSGLSNSISAPPNPWFVTSSAVAGGTGNASTANDGATPSAPGMGGSGGGVSVHTQGGYNGTGGGGMTTVASSSGYTFNDQLAGAVFSGATAGGNGSATGSGTVSNLNPCGGGGGAGAGTIVVAAPTIVDVRISCDGGRGGDAAIGTWFSGTGHSSAASGGGGGGGGVCIVVYNTRTDCSSSAAGGAGGAKAEDNANAAGGFSSFAGNGGAGSNGRVLNYNLSSDGS